MRVFRPVVAGIASLVLLSGSAIGIAAQEDPLPAIGLVADSGAAIVGVEEVGHRTIDLTIDSPSVGVQRARLLLPAGFDPAAKADWPLLYLLHGSGDDYTSWTRETDIANLTAGHGLLVVMPDAGAQGWYSDWLNGGLGGPPMWETFHLTELRQLLQRNWQAGDRRAVAGLSMGGFGAMSYAGRQPELFDAAASFSGLLDLFEPRFNNDLAVWGWPGDAGNTWKHHDPLTLTPALEGMSLYISYGNGDVGPLDTPSTDFDRTEALLSRTSEAFVERLDELGIAASVDAYGAGTHSWPYWERALHKAMPMLLEALGL